MMILLYIIGAIFILGIMIWSGFLTELLSLLGICLFGCLVGAAIGAILPNGTAEGGLTWGVWIGYGIYVLACISRIVNPEIMMDIYSDGSSKETFNSKYPGIMGLVISVVALIISLCK
jgi:hypothetical protein